MIYIILFLYELTKYKVGITFIYFINVINEYYCDNPWN